MAKLSVPAHVALRPWGVIEGPASSGGWQSQEQPSAGGCIEVSEPRHWDKGTSPPARPPRRNLSTHQRTWCFPHRHSRLGTGYHGRAGGGADSRELGAWWQEAGALGLQSQPRARGRGDSPPAQRSAKRSSPSSAWIRSFRLFLVAALFSTALNRVGWGCMREPRLAGCHSAETIILPGRSWQPLLTSDPEAEAERRWDYPWPLGALPGPQSKGTRNAEEAPTFPSLHSDISGDSLAASKARKR